MSSPLKPVNISDPWPSQVDYQEIIEYPTLCFMDEDLRMATPADRTPFGMPLPVTGQFTNVYRMVAADGTIIGVRLFLRGDPNRTRHWGVLQEHFDSLSPFPPFLSSFQYRQSGFLWRGRQYPLVKMQWLSGIALNLFVEKHLYERETLKKLAEQFRLLMTQIEAIRFIHGDLQHGNILVDEETQAIRLIDYDASFVPRLFGAPNREAGHPSYQHPSRSPADYGPLLDRFSALVIYVALRTLAVAPEIWFRLDNGDNLLFQREDFVQPASSRAFSVLTEALRAHHTERDMVMHLRQVCQRSPKNVPTLDRFG